jgi:hypothetical protein
MATPFFRKFPILSGARRGGDEDNEPIRAELFSLERLEQFARELAGEHHEVSKPRRFPKLLPRLEDNADVRESGVNPLVHYLRFGRLAGRNPHPMFDGEYYLANNPDVSEAGMNPLVHYVLLGGSEGRDPHPLFDGRSYLADNPGARHAGMNPLCHYLTVPPRLAS